MTLKSSWTTVLVSSETLKEVDDDEVSVGEPASLDTHTGDDVEDAALAVAVVVGGGGGRRIFDRRRSHVGVGVGVGVAGHLRPGKGLAAAQPLRQTNEYVVSKRNPVKQKKNISVKTSLT